MCCDKVGTKWVCVCPKDSPQNTSKTELPKKTLDKAPVDKTKENKQQESTNRSEQCLSFWDLGFGGQFVKFTVCIPIKHSLFTGH